MVDFYDNFTSLLIYKMWRLGATSHPVEYGSAQMMLAGSKVLLVSGERNHCYYWLYHCTTHLSLIILQHNNGFS